MSKTTDIARDFCKLSAQGREIEGESLPMKCVPLYLHGDKL